jgi:glycerate dehydrogenase
MRYFLYLCSIKNNFFVVREMKIVILDGYSAIGRSSEGHHACLNGRVVTDEDEVNPGDLSWDELKTMGEVTVYDRTCPIETVARAAEADIVLTNKVVIGKAEMVQLPHLKYIGVLATGYNVVDIDAAHERGITVTNVPAYSTESVAQMVFAHLLTVTNRTEHYAIANREGRWTNNKDFCYWDFPHMELSGKTFGIVGLGNIGMRVATIANAFGMQVCAYTSKSQDQLPSFIEKKSQEALFSGSDVISLHCPLTPDTHHLINSETLQKMKTSAILINTGRGPLVDDQAVAEALAEGRLAAFCADVLTEEPPKATNPLLNQPNAFITPHIAWASTEARARLLRVAINNVRSFLNGHPLNVV